ncbi:LysR family transcriptional regulator [Acetobacter musti]|uniref:LysR family transcriptional regulator n=1 Tax=Acetobacter musti TaxID=864732 RepID=A0ABX0JN96_9PROT|nr:LysR family transcriptional regulator [Acetobacter musti]
MKSSERPRSKKDSVPDPVKLHRLHERLDWNLLRTFQVVALERNLTRAAIQLHVTQSAVSQALRRLEHFVGCKLIVRRGNTMVLTKTGENVYRIASETYRAVRGIGDAVVGSDGNEVGTVRLLTISGVESETYDAFLRQFHVRYPRIRLEILPASSQDIVNTVLQNTGAIGLGLLKNEHPNLGHFLLIRQRYAFYCGPHHPLFGRADIRPEELQTEDFVTFQAEMLGGPLASLVFFRDMKGFSGQTTGISPSYREVRRLILAGFGIGCIPEHIARKDEERRLLWRLPPDEGVAEANIHFLWNRQARYSKAEEIFISMLTETLSSGE